MPTQNDNILTTLPVNELRQLVRKADAPNIRFRRHVLYSLPS